MLTLPILRNKVRSRCRRPRTLAKPLTQYNCLVHQNSCSHGLISGQQPLRNKIVQSSGMCSSSSPRWRTLKLRVSNSGYSFENSTIHFTATGVAIDSNVGFTDVDARVSMKHPGACSSQGFDVRGHSHVTRNMIRLHHSWVLSHVT